MLGCIEPELRPAAVHLDTYETILGLTSLLPSFIDCGLDAASFEWWFSSVVRDGFVLAAANDYAEFAVVALAALDEVMAKLPMSVA